MSRAERLLELVQLLRRHRRPVSGAALAAELGISLRTLYRDIASLQAQGAAIDGEPGIGYLLRPGFMLPPLMFSEDEIEALVLGSRWVAERADDRLGHAARNALAKIAAVLPPDLRESLDASALLVGPGEQPLPGQVELSLLREAIRAERKLALRYLDLKGAETQRTVWPFALGYFERVRVLVAWCETRQDFRHFRADRLREATRLEARYPQRRQALLRRWRERQGIAER
ncbi:helix-turn-helix transcriptional regulator [Caldimonas tepidiphila]|uniref:helix-turn-helix transcriptional regulator n=1 Tax=Caldimonas tepidiphila TaxID=2315841 RepID=UPI000E5BD701|nr:YafY family protein [Caldimonas tepidiphila]